MSSIAQLEKKVLAAEQALAQKRSAPKTGLAYDLSFSSLEDHLRDLQTQLKVAKEQRYLEVLELVVGDQEGFGRRGTIALDLVGRLSVHLSKAIYGAARYSEVGTVGGAIPQAIKDIMDLRLAAVNPGSTRLFITGRTSPDLFGDSLLENTLETAFDILESQGPKDLVTAISEAGPRSAKNFKEFLEVLQDLRASSILSWTPPGRSPRTWKGEPEVVARLLLDLDAVERDEPEDKEFVGEIVTLSSRRDFEMQVAPKEFIRARVPKRLVERLGEFHVGQEVAARMKRELTRHRATGEERESYLLERLNPAEKESQAEL